MHNRTLPIIAGLLTLVLALAPAPVTAFVSDVPIVGLYLRSAPGGGTELGFRPSESTSSASVAIFSGQPLVGAQPPKCLPPPASDRCTPATPAVSAPCVAVMDQRTPSCASIILGSVVAPRSFSIVGDSTFTAWLNSDRAVVLDSITFVLQKVSREGKTVPLVLFNLASGQGSQLQAAPLAIDSTAKPYTFGAEVVAPIEVLEQEKLQLGLSQVRPLAGSSQAANVFVLHSTSMQTGAQVPVFHTYASYAFEDLRTGDNTLGLYLANQSLSFLPPSNETTLVRDLGSAVGQAPTELLWGAAPVDEDTVIVGNAIYRIHLLPIDEDIQAHDQTQTAPGILAALQFGLSLYVGEQKFTSLTPTVVAPTTSDDGATWFIGSIQLPRTEVPAGTPMKVALKLVGAQPHGTVAVLFGSPEFASGLRIPVEGGGLVVPAELLPPLEVPVVAPPAPPEAPNTTSIETPELPEPSKESTSESQGQANVNGAPDNAVAVKKEISARGEAPGASALLVLLIAGLVALARRRK